MRKIFFFLIFILILYAGVARAGLILNHPTYTSLSNGLVGWWTSDGKDVAGFPGGQTSPPTIYDRSGNGNDGKLYNATGTQPVNGKLVQAILFDGVDEFISIPHSSSLDITGNITMSAWIKIKQWTNDAEFIDYRSTDGKDGYAMRINDPNLKQIIAFSFDPGGGGCFCQVT